MSNFGRNFLPGPTDVRPEVLAAQVQPMFAHRGPRMQALLAAMQPALRACFGTSQPVFVATCSGITSVSFFGASRISRCVRPRSSTPM